MQFAPGESGSVTVMVDDDYELVLLEQMLTQVQEMVEPEELTSTDPLASLVGIDTTPNAPTDPAARRLFPDAYLDDAAAATEFRRYTEHDLRRTKHATVGAVLDDVQAMRQHGSISLDGDAARRWLGALNDLRLVLGTRLAVTESDAEVDAEDAQDNAEGDQEGDTDPMRVVYDWLSYLQGTLVECLEPRHT